MTNGRKDNELSEEGRRTAMTVAVVLTTAFVVGAWLWLLPMQLDNSSSANDDQVGWKSMNDSLSNEATELKESLDTLSASLSDASLVQPSEDQIDDSGSSNTGPPDTTAIVGRLQEKLSANQSGSSKEDQK